MTAARDQNRPWPLRLVRGSADPEQARPGEASLPSRPAGVGEGGGPSGPAAASGSVADPGLTRRSREGAAWAAPGPVRSTLGPGPHLPRSRVPHGAAARGEARSRHPAGRRWLPDRVRLLQRLAERAQDGGASWPRVAAAVLALRGISGDDGPTFARRVGITTSALARLEAGSSPASAVPARLRAVGGLVDWSWVDAGEVDR
ncbi:MAG TPA: hypothetical protein VFM27_21865 [Acidimicrobiales bacterium]|nr:hypothetical protein [Acidimicrobiales bacterium]